MSRTTYPELASKSLIPQSAPLDSRQVENSAGGFVYALDNWKRLNRFLILGSDKPTYYQKAAELTRENAAAVEACLTEDGPRTIAVITEISVAGRAIKNDPAIFALALAACNENVVTRTLAFAAVADVCRTGTHIFMFVEFRKALGKGFGRGMKRATGNWYDLKPVDRIAYQTVKYRDRNGFNHRRLLDLAHPRGDHTDLQRVALYRWLTQTSKGKEYFHADLPAIVRGFIHAQAADTPAAVITLIKEYRLPWEAIPTGFLNTPDVQAALLPDMGLIALIRNLGRLSKIGLIAPLSAAEMEVCIKLTNSAMVHDSKVHPFTILQALAVYKSGRGVRGGQSWPVSQNVCDALDKAFYMAFANVKSTGKRHLLAIDISGSMDGSMIGDVLSAREAAAAMAMVTYKSEPAVHMVAFETTLTQFDLSRQISLEGVVTKMRGMRMGGTDCAQPMIYATEKKIPVDVFVVYTDSETWAGRIHPPQALRNYRKAMGIDAKMIVVGMTSNGFSIADPADAGMLDIVGFDSSAPALMAEFANGEL